ncbi:peptidoglycan-binding protein [Methanosphaera cuniculi]|uniref:Putative peptidoglycan binding domain protein n=1 Tax=Methanosphaera cuniculi TaxID=1077256 RepID=A0A2A2HE79_9EURY|nr:peptidoglycan-binding protein [Methanosphaera cuniculi]PAV07630.1 hypothetical protein ASJ82_08110 [Methanosphaera cuniculi]PWL08045.1 putative peptidoglycan binding domain protein [Methanosphaera cuniculi]
MLDCKTINLKKGSTGTKVKELQIILQKKGYYDGVIDAIYGDLTVQAVKLLQREQGNSPDGWFGTKTCSKINQNTTLETPQGNTNASGQKFMKDEIIKAGKVFRQHIKNNNNYPNYLEMKNSNGKTYQVSRALYMGIFEGMNMFSIKKGRLPNYVVANSTANNPLCIDYQNNGYNCGPTSLSMCIQMYGEYISESTLANVCGTTRNGTSPASLNSGAKKIWIQIIRNST